MPKINKNALVVAAAAGLVGTYKMASAQVVIGNWETPLVGSGQVAPANIQPSGPSGTLNAVGADGWVDWQNSAVYSESSIGATNGAHSLEIQTPNLGPFGSFVQDLAISLNSTGHVADFLTSGVVAMDVTWTKAEFNGYANPPAWGSAIDQMALNASNNGVSPISGFTTVGNSAGHASTDSGRPAGDQFNGYRDPSWFAPTAQNPTPADTITATLTWDMSAFVDGNPNNGEITAAGAANNGGFINFIFATNFDSADEDPNQIAFYIDNVRLLPRVVTSGWQGGAPDPDGNSANGNSAANNWFASLNWNNGVPGVQDSVANLGTAAGTGSQTVDAENAVTLGGLVFDNTGGWSVTGAGTFTMSASSNSATISVLSGSHSVSNTLQLGSDTTITVTPAGSTLTLTNLQPTTHGITKAGSGSLVLNSVRAASLNITGGAISIAPNGTAAGASQIGSLIVAGGATLNLNNNGLVVSSATSPSSIKLLVKAAYDNGAWDQPGITSSMARSNHHLALAVLSGSEYTGLKGTTSFDGLSFSPGDTVVTLALGGDANLDGKVNASDFDALAAHYGTTTNGLWTQGDFTYDGVVNTADFNTLAANFNQVLSAPALGTLVPEPASMGALVLIMSAARRRRSGRASLGR